METKSIIEMLDYERHKLNNIINTVQTIDPQAQITQRMNIKEILGHISWYEHQVYLTLLAQKKVSNPFQELNEEEKNDRISLLYKNETFNNVKKQSDHIFMKLMELLSMVTNEQLNNENLFKEGVIYSKPWQMLIENTFIHYEEHIAGIKRWLKPHS